MKWRKGAHRQSGTAEPPPPRSTVWVTIAWMVLIVGTAVSLLAATAWHATVTAQGRQGFEGDVAQVSATLTIELQRDIDLSISTAAFAGRTDDHSAATFSNWAEALNVRERYPSATAFGYVTYVAAADLPAFATAQQAATNTPFAITPPGTRPGYCFVTVVVPVAVQTSNVPPLAGIDVCALGFAALPQATDNSMGTAIVSLPATAGIGTLAVVAPVFVGSNGAGAGNRGALEGWLISGFDGDHIVSSATAGHPGMHVELTRAVPGGLPIAQGTAGSSSIGANVFDEATHLEADGAWALDVRESAGPASTAALRQGLAVAAAGLTLAISVFVMLRKLPTARDRALALVAARTGELRAANAALGRNAEKLVEIGADRQRLLARTVDSAEQERTRIALDLHDGPIQRLTAVGYGLDRLNRQVGRDGPSPLADLAATSRQQLTAEIDSLRKIMSDLRPPVLDQAGLEGALRDCASDFQRTTGTHCDVEINTDIDLLDRDPATVLYRITQEALANVTKHAGAGHVQITVAASGTGLALCIADDGVGFDPVRVASLVRNDHFGLAGIAQRVETVGGTLDIISSPEAGTRINVTLPGTVAWPAGLPEFVELTASSS